MACDVPLIFYSCEDGDPWALFAWGNIHKCNFTLDRCIEALSEHGGYSAEDAKELLGETVTPETYWIRLQQDEFSYEGQSYFFCKESDPGAQRITGVRF